MTTAEAVPFEIVDCDDCNGTGREEYYFGDGGHGFVKHERCDGEGKLAHLLDTDEYVMLDDKGQPML